MKNLNDTIELMNSPDYKERFKAEYYQTKIRYEKLKALNAKIDAAREVKYSGGVLEMPKHDCPDSLLKNQQLVMGDYLYTLEMRAVIENIEL